MTEPVEVGQIREYVATILGAVAAVAAVGFGILRSSSKLRVTTKKDGDEVQEVDRKNELIATLYERIAHLERDIGTMASERNTAVSALGGFETKVEMLTQMMERQEAEAREERLEIKESLERRERQVDELQRRLERGIATVGEKVEQGNKLTQEGNELAADAFREANNVNTKIEKLAKAGLVQRIAGEGPVQISGEGPLSDHD